MLLPRVACHDLLAQSLGTMLILQVGWQPQIASHVLRWRICFSSSKRHTAPGKQGWNQC
jgi:hypothetical protein